MRYLFSSLVLLGVVGCAHGTMRGSVAMKTTNDEAHVCLGDNEVKAGDRVTLYNQVCTTGVGGRFEEKSCKLVDAGGATVEKTLNEHYSVIKVDQGVDFKEGTVVQKN